MFYHLSLWIFMCLSVLFSLQGVIYEVKDLKHFEEEIAGLDSHSLVLFDLDYTIITPKDAALKPCGKDLRREYLHVLDRNEREWLQSIIGLEAKEELVDHKFPILIKKLEKHHISVMGFTALETGQYGKIANLEDWRLKQLESVGIHFLPYFHHAEAEMTLHEICSHSGHHPLYKNGVLFTHCQEKGEVFIAFLRRIGWKPKKVLFMDDSLVQVKSVEMAAQVLGIEFIGFYYTASVHNRCAFDPTLGAFQFTYLVEHEKWLSDEEARQLQLIM